ncbi:hypothetical protein [uncultured Prochlorococcus sp.]|uniref:hypothetical protein n=1 Tax=uncultured Prochlorococcus sp. TaxID=159733 RepID=UPI00258AB862|nr:hypothetical protein [uncultured Prochlorococcus sp.]
MSFTIRTIYLTPEEGFSTNVMDAIKFIVEKNSKNRYGSMSMTTLDSSRAELRKKLGLFCDDTLMRIVETEEEGKELIDRFNKACSLLEELPVNETASIIKLFHQTNYYGEVLKDAEIINKNVKTKILDI